MFDEKNLELSEIMTQEKIDHLSDYFLRYVERKIFFPEEYSHNDIYEQWKPGPKTLKETETGFEFIGKIPISGEILMRGRIKGGYISLENSSEKLLRGFAEQHRNSLREINEMEFKEFFSKLVRNLGLDFTCNRFPYVSFSKSRMGHKKKISYDDVRNSLIFRNKLFFRPFEQSKMLWVEINPLEEENMDHFLTEYEMMYVVKSFLGANPVFASVPSTLHGRHYMLFKFNEYLPDSTKKKLEEYFLNEMGFKMKIFKKDDSFYTSYEDYIPLPFNSDNLFYGEFNRCQPIKVIPDSILNILDEIENTPESSCQEIKNLVGSFYEGIVIQGERSQENIGTLTQSLEDRAQKFAYGNGTRYENQRKLAFWCCYHELDLHDYKILARSLNNGSSKDMRAWTEAQADRELERYYTYAENNVTVNVSSFKKSLGETQTDGIVDRRDVLTILDTDCFVREKFLGVVKIWYDHLYPSKKSQGLWRKYFLRDAEELFKFILRKKAYDDETNRIYLDPDLKALEQGTCVPQKIWDKLVVHLELRTGIKRLLALFEQAGLLTRIDIGGYNFSWKKIFYSIHFNITITMDSLMLLYKQAKMVLNSICSSLLNYIEEVVEAVSESDPVKSLIPRRMKVFDSGFS